MTRARERPPNDEGPSRERVVQALRDVDDPTTGTDVVTSGLVDDVDVTDEEVVVRAGLSELDESTRPSETTALERAAAGVPGVESARVEAADGGGTTATATERFDRVIAVASAKGGVGKSTVATTLACALAEDDEVALFDADVHGPNLPTLLGVSGPVHSTEDGRPEPVSVSGDDATLELMSVGLLKSGAPLAWRGSMAHEAVSELFADTAWTNEGTLVIDLPPGTGDVVLTTLQEVPVDGVVVVTTPFHASVDDTARSVELFRDEGVPVLGAVVNMAGATCPSCGEAHELFPGDGVDDLAAPVLAELPFTPELQQQPTPGTTPDPAAPLAEAVRDAAEAPWSVDAPDGTVDIRGAPAGERRERVREAFRAHDPSEPFRLLSDRDPSPVVEFLADLAGEPAAAFETRVERRTPEDWLLTAKPP